MKRYWLLLTLALIVMFALQAFVGCNKEDDDDDNDDGLDDDTIADDDLCPDTAAGAPSPSHTLLVGDDCLVCHDNEHALACDPSQCQTCHPFD